MNEPHQSHPDISKRLKRAAGHLATVIEMIEDERSCLDIAQQLHAVEKAVAMAKRTLIHDHIDHCLERSASKRGGAPNNALEEFKAISKYL